MLFFWLTPSMKMLMLSLFWAPLCTFTLPRVVDVEADARRQVGEGQEVARDLRQLLDLLRG